MPMMWMDGVTENPAVGAVETWNIRNFTMDAHPIHIHLVQFQVVQRVVTDPMMSPHGMLGAGRGHPARAVGDGLQGHRHRLSGRADRGSRRGSTTPGLFVWHCHILEHEDNEMMRPYPGRAGAAAGPVTTQPQ